MNGGYHMLYYYNT